MKTEIRTLHLLSTGISRTEMEGTKEYLVFPVVALMEGVIHAVNNETPEFVSVDVLTKAAASWDRKPIVLHHPKDAAGRQCSADTPEILASHGMGEVRNPRVEGKKLLCEAWVEKARAKKLHPEMFQDLEANKPVEVSVGAFVASDYTTGVFGGKPYVGRWNQAIGDHLAFLPGGRGACSMAMGCGTHRAAAVFHALEDAGIRTIEREVLMVKTFSTLDGQPLDDRIQMVKRAVSDEWNETPEPYAYASQVFDDFVIVCQGDETWQVPYTVGDDGTVALGKPKAVKQAWVAAEGLRTAAGARHSNSDKSLIQGMHDSAMALGADCDRANYKTLEAERDSLKEQLTLRAAADKPCGCHGNKDSNTDTALPIRLEGGQWVVFSEDGTRRLGAHTLKSDAEKQGQAIARVLAKA